MGAAGDVAYRTNGEVWRPPQFGTARLGPTEIQIKSPAGGGWGDPKRRHPELVLLDVRNGVVSEAVARGIYGVVLAADGRSIDIEATRKLRGG
jgi:N-methylhydantoinase B